MESGALWAYCWGLGLALVDFGHIPRSNYSLKTKLIPQCSSQQKENTTTLTIKQTMQSKKSTRILLPSKQQHVRPSLGTAVHPHMPWSLRRLMPTLMFTSGWPICPILGFWGSKVPQNGRLPAQDADERPCKIWHFVYRYCVDNKYVRLRGRPYIHTCRLYAWPVRTPASPAPWLPNARLAAMAQDTRAIRPSLNVGNNFKISTARNALSVTNYYTFKDTVFCTMLDATKAFDRVEYCKLLRCLLQRKLPFAVLRLIMYTDHVTRVVWNGIKSQGCRIGFLKT